MYRVDSPEANGRAVELGWYLDNAQLNEGWITSMQIIIANICQNIVNFLQICMEHQYLGAAMEVTIFVPMFSHFALRRSGYEYHVSWSTLTR